VIGPQKESPVIQRRTQTAAYWQEQFTLTEEDVGSVYDLILDQGSPVPTAILTQALIERHCRQEERILKDELSKGAVYQPKDVYKVGQSIIFPALDYALGTVVGTRPGSSPGHGDFVVIQVKFEDDNDIREFASGLHGEHELNREAGEEDIWVTEDLLPVAELCQRHGFQVGKMLVSSLQARSEFVAFRERWFLRDLLVPIQLVHLNIAEALVEIKSMPLPTIDFLSDLELPAESSEEIRLFSINCALEADERFDNVGDGDRDIWYLRRLTPELVVNPPARLAVRVESYERQDIAQELLLIEREIDDEGSGEEVMGPSRPIYRTTIALIYPHWRSGTLPLTVRTRGLFPQASTHHTPVVLIDGQSGSKMQGWVVHEASFVYGLGNWYKRYRLPVGAFIKLERTRDPRVITVDFEARRLKNLWSKIALVQEGKLVFQVRKMPITCEYDDQLTIGEDNPQAIDRLCTEINARDESLLQIMTRIVPELSKLSPQGTVHAKTIYSAVNILKRTPPGPVFALLSNESRFVSMGGGYWAFDEALV
jgi:hypothetical protein